MGFPTDQEAFPWGEAPMSLVRDRDQIYGAILTSLQTMAEHADGNAVSSISELR